MLGLQELEKEHRQNRSQINMAYHISLQEISSVPTLKTEQNLAKSQRIHGSGLISSRRTYLWSCYGQNPAGWLQKWIYLRWISRTIPQAEALTARLEKIGQKMDYAIDVDVPDENIVNRMSGRRACLNCGATYHIVSIPTKVEGICDRCGSPVVLRDDDKPETVRNV